MTNEQFDKILEERIAQMCAMLANKGKEYGHGDRLHNFKVAAGMSGNTPQRALWGMMAKHLVSVLDLVEGRLPNTEGMVNEKIGDAINYLVLLEAVFMENRELVKGILNVGLTD